ncbi:Hypothetical predicted protein [Paramuricea clavata]|uniref:Uncharacterized protein n=1 Tax=Paramuricea clavata TaxID=317549 RepID=A0A6S7HAJ1_PARCT|nr:Hypothetical predicted protein [Paramuricea clavata]
MCFGIYTCSPYIVTIGIVNNALFFIDTHPVTEELGSDGNGVLLVTPDLSYRSCQLLVQWLLLRLAKAGVETDSRQSLVWLTAHQDEKCNDSTAEGILDKGYLHSRVPSEEAEKTDEDSSIEIVAVPGKMQGGQT